ncbi:hypothetical protein EIP86_011442 [Pleurotus ostreatoroseus]|nr:hypothetical protein EIP86_011442 [Pleurotus ostreatoroseus]
MSENTESPRAFRLPFRLYAKYHDEVAVSEALATQYVSLNKTIPVPTILDVMKDNDKTFFLMTQVPGRPFGRRGTLVKMSDTQTSVLEETMRDWIAQVRVLPPPPNDAVCGFLGTSFQSFRLDYTRRIEPFDSVDTFHNQRSLTLPPTAPPGIQSLAARVRSRRHRLCFTHGDISPDNILADENCKPVGLVDWECAAWMPEYWELTATVVRRQSYRPWMEVFKRIFPQYREELAVEIELWKTACPF